jgi:hypothetical protein
VSRVPGIQAKVRKKFHLSPLCKSPETAVARGQETFGDLDQSSLMERSGIDFDAHLQ